VAKNDLPISLRFEVRYLAAISMLAEELSRAAKLNIDSPEVEEVLGRTRFSHQEQDCGSIDEEYSLNHRMREMVSYYLARSQSKNNG